MPAATLAAQVLLGTSAAQRVQLYSRMARSMAVSLAMLRAVVIALAVILPLASESFAVPITTPGTLPPGAQYRLAFLTSGTTIATSSDITSYDAFVQGAADAVPELLALGTTWQVIGSTPTDDAITHTGTGGIGVGATVPIYNLFGSLVATNGADLWDGSILSRINVDEFGGFPTSQRPAWTGTDRNGFGFTNLELGGPSPIAGDPSSTNFLWMELGTQFPDEEFPLYAISSVLTVPEPEPSTSALLTLGVVALLRVRRVRAR